MEATIKIKCQRCGRQEETIRTNELPEIVHHLEGNYCPYCVTAGDDYWEELWVDENGLYVVQKIEYSLLPEPPKIKHNPSMEKETIKEGNEIIAKFMSNGQLYPHPSMSGSTAPMGYKLPNGWWNKDALEYHSSWDWLMPVVEKIESLGFQFFIHNEGSYMRKWHWMGNFPDFGNMGETKIQAAWNVVTEFIKWYNTQPQ